MACSAAVTLTGHVGAVGFDRMPEPGKPVLATGAITPCDFARSSATPALLGLLRDRPDTDVTRGVAVVAVGIIEAVAVCDGQFTPVLRCAEFPRTIVLELTEKMRKQALDNLCRWVAVGGRLYSVDANRFRLEVHSLEAVRRSDRAERR
jgi:hypothetical protein